MLKSPPVKYCINERVVVVVVVVDVAKHVDFIEITLFFLFVVYIHIYI